MSVNATSKHLNKSKTMLDSCASCWYYCCFYIVFFAYAVATLSGKKQKLKRRRKYLPYDKSWGTPFEKRNKSHKTAMPYPMYIKRNGQIGQH